MKIEFIETFPRKKGTSVLAAFNNIRIFSIEYERHSLEQDKSYYWIYPLFLPYFVFTIDMQSINIGGVKGKKYKTLEEAKAEIVKLFDNFLNIFNLNIN
jgi:hypothetical protein